MSKHRSTRFPPCHHPLTGLKPGNANAVLQSWHTLRRSRRRPPVAVLIADRAQRRSVEREIWRGLRRLQPVLSAPLPTELAVVVQQVVLTDRQLAGCSLIGQYPDGSRFALVRLALQVNGQRLTMDELLAVLAEQYIGVLTQQNSSVLVPVELEPGQVESRRPTLLRSDPLAAHPNGAATGERIA